jgi:hypothetical protein
MIDFFTKYSSRFFYSSFMLFLFSYANHLAAQEFIRFDHTPVSKNGNQLRYPWTGGMNHVQFGSTDVNNDGRNDVVVFDKANNKFLVFISTAANSTSYNYVNAYGKYFPEVSGWLVLKDYNCDGIEDFFTYNGEGNIKVFTGFYRNDTLNFRLQQNGFFYSGSGTLINTYCSDVIKPAITDINKDGDLDIISFNVFGNRLIYYENLRVENGLGCDSLFFERSDNCWGNVLDSFAASYALKDTCNFKFNRLGNISEPLHTGSYIESFDADNNGALDVVIGSVTLSNLTLLYNKGTPSYASVLLQDITYPGYDVSFNTSSFGTPSFMDADNDGRPDLLVSTFDVGTANINNVWFYKNTSDDSVQLQLQQKDFLLDNMIDLGEHSSPCFIDIDGDGLKDILVGNGGFKDYSSAPLYQLQYFKNTGTAAMPAYRLESADYLNVSTFGVQDLVPAAGDVDNDNDIDLVLGLADGRLIYWENTAGAGNPVNLTFKGTLKDASDAVISIGANAAPFLIDLNRDGKTDLLIGERNGNLNYYRGNDAASAKFIFVTDSLGKLRIRTPFNSFGYTHPVVADINNDGNYDLILGTNLSGLQFYNNIEDNLNGTFALTSLIASADLGYRLTASIDDITNDSKPELLTGTISGGLILFSQDPPDITGTFLRPSDNSLPFSVFPNPADGQITIQFNQQSNAVYAAELYSSIGQLIRAATKQSGQTITISAADLADGMYIIRLTDGIKEGFQKLIIQH